MGHSPIAPGFVTKSRLNVDAGLNQVGTQYHNNTINEGIINTRNPWTIMWFMHNFDGNDGNVNRDIFNFKRDISTSGVDGITIAVKSGQLRINISVAGTTVYDQLGILSLVSSISRHYAITHEYIGVDSVFKVYKNSNLVATETYSNSAVISITPMTYITLDSTRDKTMSHVCFLEKTLTQEEIYYSFLNGGVIKSSLHQYVVSHFPMSSGNARKTIGINVTGTVALEWAYINETIAASTNGYFECKLGTPVSGDSTYIGVSTTALPTSVNSLYGLRIRNNSRNSLYMLNGASAGVNEKNYSEEGLILRLERLGGTFNVILSGQLYYTQQISSTATLYLAIQLPLLVGSQTTFFGLVKDGVAVTLDAVNSGANFSSETGYRDYLPDVVEQYNYAKHVVTVEALADWTIAAGMSVNGDQLTYDGTQPGTRASAGETTGITIVTDYGKTYTVTFNIVSNTGHFYVFVGGSTANEYRVNVTGTGQRSIKCKYTAGGTTLHFSNAISTDTSGISDVWTVENIDIKYILYANHGALINYTDEEVGATNPSTQTTIKDFYNKSILNNNNYFFSGLETGTMTTATSIDISSNWTFSFKFNPIERPYGSSFRSIIWSGISTTSLFLVRATSSGASNQAISFQFWWTQGSSNSAKTFLTYSDEDLIVGQNTSSRQLFITIRKTGTTIDYFYNQHKNTTSTGVVFDVSTLQSNITWGSRTNGAEKLNNVALGYTEWISSALSDDEIRDLHRQAYVPDTNVVFRHNWNANTTLVADETGTHNITMNNVPTNVYEFESIFPPRIKAITSQTFNWLKVPSADDFRPANTNGYTSMIGFINDTNGDFGAEGMWRHLGNGSGSLLLQNYDTDENIFSYIGTSTGHQRRTPKWSHGKPNIIFLVDDGIDHYYYLNGVYLGGNGHTANFATFTQADFLIGQYLSSAGRATGYFSQFGFWNRILSQREVVELSNNTLMKNPTLQQQEGLLLYPDFNNPYDDAGTLRLPNLGDSQYSFELTNWTDLAAVESALVDIDSLR